MVPPFSASLALWAPSTMPTLSSVSPALSCGAALVWITATEPAIGGPDGDQSDGVNQSLLAAPVQVNICVTCDPSRYQRRADRPAGSVVRRLVRFDLRVFRGNCAPCGAGYTSL